MEIRTKDTCFGCLNNGRRMVEISETNLLKCFSEIINENLMSDLVPLLQLCFECKALLLKFTKFKIQVAACYRTFQKLNSSFNGTPITRLCTKQLPNIDTLLPSQSNIVTEVTVERVKQEDDIDDIWNDIVNTDTIKEELSNHEDEVPLIKIKKKKKKPSVKLEKYTELEYTEVTLNEKEIKKESSQR